MHTVSLLRCSFAIACSWVLMMSIKHRRLSLEMKNTLLRTMKNCPDHIKESPCWSRQHTWLYSIIQKLGFVEFSVWRDDVLDGGVCISCQGTIFQPGSTGCGRLCSWWRVAGSRRGLAKHQVCWVLGTFPQADTRWLSGWQQRHFRNSGNYKILQRLRKRKELLNR